MEISWTKIIICQIIIPQVQIYCVTIILSFKSFYAIDPIKAVFEEKKLDEYTTVCYSQDNSAYIHRVYG
jgi:hypothetical protein